MSVTKGSNQKFSKKRTSVSTPAITKPTIQFTSLNWNGAADIDENNHEKFYFHVFGAAPSDVKLYIYGDQFNQAFYTELGEHSHGGGTLQTGNVNIGDTNHNHTTSTYHRHYNNFTSGADYHNHRMRILTGSSWGGVTTSSGAAHFTYGLIEGEDEHAHPVQGYTNYQGSGAAASTSVDVNAHQHLVASGSSANSGISPAAGSVRVSGSPKEYFDDLQIEIDSIDRTAALKTQAGVAKFGDGTSGHSIVVSGIELDLKNYVTTPGEHKIIFTLPGSDNGGKLRWNLYIF